MALKKSMRKFDVWALAVGAIIGWGCFVLPGNAFLPKAGPLGMIIGFSIGAVLSIIISFSYGYLVRKFPIAGGGFVYAASAFGKGHSFICGWFLVLAYWSLIPLNGTATGLLGRYLFPGLLQRGLLYEIAGWEVYTGELLAGLAILTIMAYANIRGVKLASWIQNVIVVMLIGSIMVVAAGFLIKGVNWHNLMPGFQPNKSTLSCILAMVAMSSWGYFGFDCIPQAAEEYDFSHKKVLFLMSASVVAAALMLFTVNTMTSIVMPWQTLLDSKPFWATGLAVEMVMGKFGLFVIGIAMFCGIVSGINAFFLTVTRLLYAMAKADALPAWFGVLDEKYGTPKNATIFTLVLSLIAPFFGREVLNWIVEMTAAGAAIAYAYTTASAIVIAKRYGDKKNVIMGILGFLSSSVFLVLLLVPGMPGFLPMPSLAMLFIWSALGVIFYYKTKEQYMKSNKMEELLADMEAHYRSD